MVAGTNFLQNKLFLAPWIYDFSHTLHSDQMNDKIRIYDDLVGKNVHARLYDKDSPEWQRCKVIQLCNSGLKLKSTLTQELHLVANGDIPEDIRVDGAFIPWEYEQKPYDGTLVGGCAIKQNNFYLITHIHFLSLHVASATNPGETFGQCGIGTYEFMERNF